MRILLAPDSFKNSLSAAAAAEAMAVGIGRVTSGGDPAIEVDRCPISDGGEGFVAALSSEARGTTRHSTVAGPLGDAVEATWATLPNGSAVIEMAAASGLELVNDKQRNPRHTTTLGTGHLIADALRQGYRRVLVGLGGSATSDGGTGMAQALGVRFFDAEDRLIARPMCGGRLLDVRRIDMAGVLPILREAKIEAACDVTNPLTGSTGAAAVYGPQKGALPEDIEQLDAGLRHLARLLREQHGIDIETTPGSGAAGGLGAGLIAFAGAELRSGIALTLDAVGFVDRVQNCDLCLTGEGRLDGQSLLGKAILGVARAAQAHGVPTVALVGSASDDAKTTLDRGLNAYHEISAGYELDYAIQHANELLAAQTRVVVQAWIDHRGR